MYLAHLEHRKAVEIIGNATEIMLLRDTSHYVPGYKIMTQEYNNLVNEPALYYDCIVTLNNIYYPDYVDAISQIYMLNASHHVWLEMHDHVEIKVNRHTNINLIWINIIKLLKGEINCVK